MNRAKKLLIEYQQNNFPGRVLCDSFDGFDLRAYPETAEGKDLDKIGKAIRVLPSKEDCSPYRDQILTALETPDQDEAA